MQGVGNGWDFTRVTLGSHLTPWNVVGVAQVKRGRGLFKLEARFKINIKITLYVLPVHLCGTAPSWCRFMFHGYST